MTNVRLGLPTVLVIVAVVGAGAFAAGRAMPDTPRIAAAPDEPLPAGHPTVESVAPPSAPVIEAPPAPPPAEGAFAWKAPARWESMPNTSSMRLATYRVPRAGGDADDADVSVTRAGGSIDDNATRWIGQFDPAGQKTAKRTTRKLGAYDVTIVEVHGTYSGGMGKPPAPGATWALLGAIVATPGMPHFFKVTGPEKTVVAARAELEAMVASLSPR